MSESHELVLFSESKTFQIPKQIILISQFFLVNQKHFRFLNKLFLWMDFFFLLFESRKPFRKNDSYNWFILVNQRHFWLPNKMLQIKWFLCIKSKIFMNKRVLWAGSFYGINITKQVILISQVLLNQKKSPKWHYIPIDFHYMQKYFQNILFCVPQKANYWITLMPPLKRQWKVIKKFLHFLQELFKWNSLIFWQRSCILFPIFLPESFMEPELVIYLWFPSSLFKLHTKYNFSI